MLYLYFKICSIILLKWKHQLLIFFFAFSLGTQSNLGLLYYSINYWNIYINTVVFLQKQFKDDVFCKLTMEGSKFDYYNTI